MTSESKKFEISQKNRNNNRQNPKMSYRALQKSKPVSKNLKKYKNDIGEEKNDIEVEKIQNLSTKSKK